MTHREFARGIITMIEDKGAARRASKRDLAVMQAILTVVVDEIDHELMRRDLTLINGGKP